MGKKLAKIIRPVTESELSLGRQRLCLNEMFAAAVSNAPDNELENFTAKRLAPAFLAISQLLENIRKYRKPKKPKPGFTS